MYVFSSESGPHREACSKIPFTPHGIVWIQRTFDWTQIVHCIVCSFNLSGEAQTARGDPSFPWTLKFCVYMASEPSLTIEQARGLTLSSNLYGKWTFIFSGRGWFLIWFFLAAAATEAVGLFNIPENAARLKAAQSECEFQEVDSSAQSQNKLHGVLVI